MQAQIINFPTKREQRRKELEHFEGKQVVRIPLPSENPDHPEFWERFEAWLVDQIKSGKRHRRPRDEVWSELMLLSMKGGGHDLARRTLIAELRVDQVLSSR